MTRRRPQLLLLAVLVAALSAGCGKQTVKLDSGENERVREGAMVFKDKCSGCHTLESAGTQGSAVNVRERERTDGPNFNTRPEQKDAVLYAIRNGGFSGAIMPENIVVGDTAQKVAEYLSKYAGRDAVKPVTPQSSGETP